MTELQRTPEWYADRCGCLTASAVSALYDMKRDGTPKQAYYDLLDRIIAERVSGDTQTNYVTPAMQWGIDHEDEARIEYEMRTGESVELVGFIKHPEIPYLGASPDGLVGTDGLIEIKCPCTVTHLRRIRAGVVPPEYIPQMTLQLLVTGRKWCDFVQWDPRCRGDYKHLRYWTVRFEPTQEALDDMRDKCSAFLAVVEQELASLLITI